MTHPEEGMRAAMERAGLTPPLEIIGDGKLRRFASNGKRGDDAGWYVLHAEGDIPAGEFGCWRTGIVESWRADLGRTLTPAEEEAHRARVAKLRAERDAEAAVRREEARARAGAIWSAATPASLIQRYCRAKGIKPHIARHFKGDLVLPVFIEGAIHSLQFIAANGEKRFLPGGRVAGGYVLLGLPAPNGELVVCEGFATGASIHEATTMAVAVAFNAGNVPAVARALRTRFPEVKIVVAADDDAKTPGNPGLTKATEAARAVGGLLAVPDFGESRPEGATDFNDLARARGHKAVRASIEGATCVEPAGGAQTGGASSAPSPRPARATGAALDGVQIIRADTIKPEPVEWLWEGYLAAGKLHVMAGAPGTGKTTLALAFAATVSSAGRWPDGSRSSAGSVLIWSGEDTAADTLVPRLIASGADCARVHFVGRVNDVEGSRPFDPSSDFPALELEAARIPGIRLVIVDPIVSAIAGDSHKNAEVRRGLQPLVDFAERTECAVLGISHFSKNSSGRDVTERVTGSLAFGALARIVLATAKAGDASPEGGRLMVRAKSNIGPDGGGFRYELGNVELASPHAGIVASRVEWGGTVEGGAREILAAVELVTDPEERSDLDDAKAFLADLLADGPVPARKGRAEAEGAGHSWATIRRAMKALGVKSEKEGMTGPWRWALSPKVLKSVENEHLRRCSENPEGAHSKVVSIFGKNEHLRREDAPDVETGSELL